MKDRLDTTCIDSDILPTKQFVIDSQNPRKILGILLKTAELFEIDS